MSPVSVRPERLAFSVASSAIESAISATTAMIAAISRDQSLRTAITIAPAHAAPPRTREYIAFAYRDDDAGERMVTIAVPIESSAAAATAVLFATVEAYAAAEGVAIPSGVRACLNERGCGRCWGRSQLAARLDATVRVIDRARTRAPEPEALRPSTLRQSLKAVRVLAPPPFVEVRRSSSHGAASASTTSNGSMKRSSTRRSRVNRYFAIGNEWSGGSGSTK